MRISNLISSHLPLKTTRLILRKITFEDAPVIFKTYTSDPEVTKNASWMTHKSVNETKDFVKFCLDKWENEEEFNLAICLKENPENPIGMLKIKFNSETGNIGYVLAKKYWNRGYTTEAVKAIVSIIFSFESIKELKAITDFENVASISVLKKAGFIFSHRLPKHLIRPQLSSHPRDSLVFKIEN